MIEFRLYVDDGGRKPFERWFDALNPEAAARVETALARLADGNVSNVKAVGSGVNEVKINFGPGYRLYFGWDGETVVILLGGGIKKRQQRDIATAQERWCDYRIRRS